MPKDLFDYLKKMVEEHNANPENAYCPTDFSKMVQKAIRTMMEADRSSNSGQAMPDLPCKMGNVAAHPRTGPKVVRPDEQSVGGSSTATTSHSQKAGRRKSSN